MEKILASTTTEHGLLRNTAMALIQSFLHDQIITPQDLLPFAASQGDKTDPEYVRQEMEQWYVTLGIEAITRQKFSLSRPPFTSRELAEAYELQEMILCVPRRVTHQQLGKLFHFSSWALEDELVSETTEVEDFWFKTRCSQAADYLDRTGKEIQKIFEREGKLGMSLSRYMVFAARMRYLTGQTPDTNYWTWLTRGRYAQKQMLIAGFDTHLKLSVHAWLPHFHSPHCGARYLCIPDHL